MKKAAEIFDGKEVTEFQVMTLTLPAEKGFYCMRDLMHTNPFEVGLEHGIDGNRSFIGKEALADIREKGAEKEMVGFNVNQADVQINHKCFGGPGDPVMKDGEEAGRVSKFTYSFMLDKNIGYILARKGCLKTGDKVLIHGYEAVIADKPFV